jgi:Integrase core domain
MTLRRALAQCLAIAALVIAAFASPAARAELMGIALEGFPYRLPSISCRSRSRARICGSPTRMRRPSVPQMDGPLSSRTAPFYDAHEVKLCRVLTDRGTEYCGNPEHHEYKLCLALEDVDHSRTKTKSPQTNGIVERFHKTALDEFYRVAFRKKIYGSITELQGDLDSWVHSYNDERPHQGRGCFGKTPMQTFLTG